MLVSATVLTAEIMLETLIAEVLKEPYLLPTAADPIATKKSASAVVPPMLEKEVGL